ncbi:MAG: dihydrolipoyl dehydrogenase [Acidobacteriota bacterium]
MSAKTIYDVVIIGSGPGGYVAAIRAAQLGLRTAVVEKDKGFGGTCLHRGCIPTKALLENADLYEQMQNAREFGITVEGLKLDFETVQKRKIKIVRKLAKGVEFLLNKNKVDTYGGFGRLIAPGEVEVEASQGNRVKLETKNIIIATGSVPKSLPNLDIDGKRIISSDHVLELTSIPKSMIILGAGAVGVEFASIYARFGSQITLVEMLPQLLPLEDEELGTELQKTFKRQGIKALVGTAFQSATVKDDSVEVTVKNIASGETSQHKAELLLVAVGRRPLLENLGLEKTKVQVERGYITVDKYQRTAEPNIYAIGDVIPTPLLAHVASAEGIVAVEHIAGNKELRPVNYSRIPSCTYCDPEVASVGLTERQAREHGYQLKIGKFPFTANSKAGILGRNEGFIKIVSDSKYDEILGVHAIGPRVTEMIAEACIALQGEFTSEELARTMHAHPTLSEGIVEAAHAVYGLPIHI